jgi:GT2 family glycosyltransferase
MIEGKLAFVILTWNSGAYIRACLDSVLSLQSREPIQIFLTDNGSTDGTIDILKEFASRDPARLHLDLASENEGTTKPRNRMLKMIPGDTDWICVLDSDTVVYQDAIERLIDSLKNRPRALLAAPRMWTNKQEEQMSCKKFPTVSWKIMKAFPLASVQKKAAQMESYPFFPSGESTGRPPVSSDQNIYEVDYAISACWMLRADIRELVGYLDEYYLYAPEDVDYCATIWENGYEVLFVSGSSIIHDTQRLSHKKRFSALNQAHIKGLIYYFRKFHYISRPKMRSTGK